MQNLSKEYMELYRKLSLVQKAKVEHYLILAHSYAWNMKCCNVEEYNHVDVGMFAYAYGIQIIKDINGESTNRKSIRDAYVDFANNF